MNFSLGGVKRGTLVVTATLLLTVGVSACSSDGESPLDDAKKSSAAPDPAAADKAAVEDLVTKYWRAVTLSENNGDTDPKQFEGLTTARIAEDQLSRVADYNKVKLKRVGGPVLSEIEVNVSGDSATVALCLNEDKWTAEVEGDPLPDQKKFGTKPWGAELARVDAKWVVSVVRAPAEGSKVCA